MLKKKALLVSVGISQWVGRKLDKRATGTVEVTHATQKSVGNYTKKLLPGSHELNKIQSVAGNIRKFYYKNTLPWMTDGARIVSAKYYLEFIVEFGKMKAEFQSAVNDFLLVYPRLQSEARAKLGDLYSDLDYPREERLTKLFACNVTFMPMSDGEDFRTEILDSEKENYLKKMRETDEAGLRECWTRLHAVITRATDTLSVPDAIFRDTLLENIQEMCELLPRLNINDDPDLEAARQRVMVVASEHSPEACRNSVLVREDAARKLKDIQNSMGAFMGGH